MMKRLLLVGLALSALGLVQATPARADGLDSGAVLTLSQTAGETGPLERASHAAAVTVGVEQDGQTAGSSSQMSRLLTLIVLIGSVGICLGSLLTHFRTRVPVANR
jgi:hypothetical protein